MTALYERMGATRTAGLFSLLTSLAIIPLTACDTKVEERAPAQTALPPLPNSTAPPKDSIEGSRSPLQWDLAILEQVLMASGLNHVKAGMVRQPFLGDQGVIYRVDGAELQVFLYADAGAVARDTDLLDTTRVAPPTMQIRWRMPPTLIVDNNMVVILLTTDSALRRKVRAAIKNRREDNKQGAGSRTTRVLG